MSELNAIGLTKVSDTDVVMKFILTLPHDKIHLHHHHRPQGVLEHNDPHTCQHQNCHLKYHIRSMGSIALTSNEHKKMMKKKGKQVEASSS